MNIDIERYTKATKKTFEDLAKEPFEVEYIKGSFYAFGSELATLRLFYAYRYSWFNDQKADIGYSPTHSSHYFRLETTIIN